MKFTKNFRKNIDENTNLISLIFFLKSRNKSKPHEDRQRKEEKPWLGLAFYFLIFIFCKIFNFFKSYWMRDERENTKKSVVSHFYETVLILGQNQITFLLFFKRSNEGNLFLHVI